MKLNLLAIIITPLLFSGCFGGGDEGSSITADGTFKLYESSDFSIAVPSDWEIKEKDDFPSNVPTSTVVSFQDKIKDERFTTNVNVSISSLPEGTSSKDLALSTLAKARNSLISFTELNREDFGLRVNDESTLESLKITFSGKKTSIEDIVEFKQVYFAKDNTGYVVTAAYLPDSEESIVNFADEMLNSFALK